MSIHINFLEEEAKEGKKLILDTQFSLLKTSRSFNNYARLRKKELTIKSSISNKLKNVSLLLQNFETFLPKIEENSIPKYGKDRDDERIEAELRQIRDRISNLAI